MFPPPELMSDEQARHWAGLKAGIEKLIAESGDDPWMLHGTSQSAAQSILANGFDPGTSWIEVEDEAGKHAGVLGCVYWTRILPRAENFAFRKSDRESGFPVILMARLSDVVASGTPVPELSSWLIDCDEKPELKPRDWRHSLESLHAIGVLGCRRVANLRAVCVAPLDQRPDPAVIAENQERFFATIRSPAMG